MMSVKKQIFLVEDDPNFGLVLKSYLELHDFEVEWINDGANAQKAFLNQHFDICILDVMLPNRDGFQIAKQIRAARPEVPFIFLTAKTLKEDIVKGYQLGADDYLNKPFDSEVLIFKINAILSRGKTIAPPTNIYEIGTFQFNYQLRIITHKGAEQKLSPKEADLLKMLIHHKNNILPRTEALSQIWGDESYFTTRSMDVYISKLRKYLKADSNITIENIHGTGFRLLEK